jgi:hypothetical protein
MRSSDSHSLSRRMTGFAQDNGSKVTSWLDKVGREAGGGLSLWLGKKPEIGTRVVLKMDQGNKGRGKRSL